MVNLRDPHVSRPAKKRDHLSMSKALNPKKPMPIIIMGAAQNKENGDGLVPKKMRMSTGVEKEEEKEQHLQDAIMYQKASLKGSVTASIASIPIPRLQMAIIDEKWTQKVQNNQRWNLLLRDKTRIKSVPPTDYCMRDDSYEIDEEDAAWLESLGHTKFPISADEFETIFEVLENNSRRNIIRYPSACLKLKNVDRTKIGIVYDYWIEKRMRICKLMPLASLIPVVPSETLYGDHDPYVAFRKREVDLRRRSVRIAYHTALENSIKDENHVISEEEKRNIYAERLFNMSHMVNINSEVDGRFSFDRNRRCRYRIARKNSLPIQPKKNL